MTIKLKAGLLAFISCLLIALLTLSLLKPPAALSVDAPSTEFSAVRAMEHLHVIAKEPHSVGTLEGQQVIDYIVQELEELGLDVHIQDTLVSRFIEKRNTFRVSRVKNVIGHLRGTDNSKAVLLMAHHDSQPNTPAAADDGSGVVAILETVRAIREGQGLKNDLIVLITDAEEIGLMGAKAFVDYHPLLKEVGMVINLEARGNKGLSVSFEMNPENGWVAKEFSKAAPYPFANSMAYEIYKVLPNDSDFSEFRKTDVAGVNSACVEGFVNYHSMTDTPENMDQDLLQHHGSNMLGMVNHFGHLNIQTNKAPDAIFFNPIGSWLVLYPASYDVYFFIIAVLLFVLTVGIGARKNAVDLAHIFIGVGNFLVLLTLSGVGCLVLQQLILKIYPHYTLYYANNYYNVGFYFLFFIGFVGLLFSAYYSFFSKVNSFSLSLGAVLMLLMSMFGLTISLPTATYTLYYPIIFYLFVQLLLLYFNINADNKPMPYGLGQIAALAPAIGLWTQTIYLVFVTFGLSEALIAPILVFCFLLSLMIPIIRMISLERRWILMGLSLALFFGSFLGGHLSSGWDVAQPLQTFLLYKVDVDKKEAEWASEKNYQPDWVKAYTESEVPFIEDDPALLPSHISILQDTTNQAEQRVLDLKIAFPKFVNSISVTLEDAPNITQIKLNDFNLYTKTKKTSEQTLKFDFFAPPPEGFVLQIIGTNEQQKLSVSDRSLGLPPQILKNPLPKDMIFGPSYYSNIRLIKKAHSF